MSGSEAECRLGVPCGHPFLPTLEVGPGYASMALQGRFGDAPLLLDCRREDEVRAVSLPNHLNIPLDELCARSNEVQSALDARSEAKHAEMLIICHHGRRSLYAANSLKACGFSGARSIVGGIDLWARVIDSSLPRYTKTACSVSIIRTER